MKRWADVGMGCMFAGAYYAAARFGLYLATLHGSASPVWPASGLAVAVLIRYGGKFWPGLFLGAFFANLANETPLLAALGIAAGNTLAGILSARWIPWLIGRPSAMEEQRKTVAFVTGALFPSWVGATVGVAVLSAMGLIGAVPVHLVWLTWWIGDSLGILVVAPFLYEWRAIDRRRAGEFGVAVVGTLALASLVFLEVRSGYWLFLIHPFLFVAAERLDRLGVSTLGFILSAVAVWGTCSGTGPFHLGTLNENLLCLQLFLGSVSIAVLVLAGFREVGTLRLPGIAIGLTWLMTAALFYSFEHSASQRDERRLVQLDAQAKVSVAEKFDLYVDSLQGGVSLLVASNHVSNREWGRYAESLRIHDRFPAMRGLGVVTFPSSAAREEARIATNFGSTELDSEMHRRIAVELAKKKIRETPRRASSSES